VQGEIGQGGTPHRTRSAGPTARVTERRGSAPGSPLLRKGGSPRRAWQAEESVACAGSHRPTSSGTGAGTDAMCVDPGGTRRRARQRGGSGAARTAHTQTAEKTPTTAVWSRQRRRQRAGDQRPENWPARPAQRRRHPSEVTAHREGSRHRRYASMNFKAPKTTNLTQLRLNHQDYSQEGTKG
jgi:hypothetical protein